MFEAFPKLTRFSQDWTVTEKIDGSNAQILILAEGETGPDTCDWLLDHYRSAYILAGSRKRWLLNNKQQDHMGFARWVAENSHELIDLLGPGRHYGEWWGQGIQRGYDLKEKRFSLFNVSRWKEEEVNHIPGLHVVPIIGALGDYLGEPGKTFEEAMKVLKTLGSQAAPGYMNPEGIVMYHGRSGTMFKKTFDYDEAGKWAENQERKAA